MSQVVRTSESTVLCEMNSIEFRLLTNERIEDALTVQRESMKQEVLAVGVGMYEEPGAAEEMQLIFREVIKDGCTVIAVDLASDKVVAVAFNKLHAALNHGEKDSLAVFIENNIKHRACLDIIKVLNDIESRGNLFEKYGVRGVMEVFYIGTAPVCQGKGIGKQIVEASLQFGRGLLSGKLHKVPVCEYIINENVVPEVFFAIFTSRFSQRIQQKLGFNQLLEVRYEDYVSGGKKLSERIGNVHKTARLAIIEL